MAIQGNVWHWRNRVTGATGWQSTKPLNANQELYEWKWVAAEPDSSFPQYFVNKCCAFEKRSFRGGCLRCGDPCL